MDCLEALCTNIPDWLKRLEELNGQIEQRQRDLASLPENQRQSSARSIRNRGSTESLKPQDEAVAINPPDRTRVATPPPATQNNVQQQRGNDVPTSPVSEFNSKASLQRQTNEVMATAQRRARATLRKKQKTESMISQENTIQKYRSRNMIIVYYDSYVQSFFEELVKFVSLQRNSMRKAKMAAKVAHIKRMAELEMPDEEDDEDDDNGGGNGELKPRDNFIVPDTSAAPSDSKFDGSELRARMMNARQLGVRGSAYGRMNMRGTRSSLNGGLGSFQDRGDIWEVLDKGLEFVQGMCEHGAHQFLRDADCSVEVEKIKARLAQTKEAADQELVRVRAEKVNSPSPEQTKSRSYRPVTMRKDSYSPSSKNTPKPVNIEVEDEGIQDMDGFQAEIKPAR